MNVLVTGGTGMVGSHVVAELLSRHADVSVLTRDPGKAARLPAGVKVVQGDLMDPDAIQRVFTGFDAVFLLNQVAPTESHEGLMSVCAMLDAGTRRVVYLSVHHADRAAWLPHFGSKVGVEQALKASRLPFTVLRPNNFFQNDYHFKDAILQYGVYPQPIGGVGLSRVDVRDIAEAAAVLLSGRDHLGETIDLVGAELHTGESTAAIWSQALGRTIAYAGDDLEAWEKQMLGYGMPNWLVFDFKRMYADFQREGLKATPEAIDRQTRLLGHPPRKYDTFVQETVAAWR